MMKNIIVIIGCILLCFLIGFIGSKFQVDSINSWYVHINKSSLTPPGFVFPIAWSILYFLIGISLGLLFMSNSEGKKLIVWIGCMQLFFNFIWTFLFFYLQNPLLGLIDIIILDILVTLYVVIGLRVVPISAILFIPYMLWIYFASYLNAYIYFNN